MPLATYALLQTPRALDTGLFRRVLGGLSCRECEAAAEAGPAAFGLTKSSVSRRFIRASARELRRLMARRLDDQEWLVLLLDGKRFADDGIVIALGVTRTGEKRILGMVQTVTENTAVCASFLREIVERGFTAPHGLLVVLDGAKGLRRRRTRSAGRRGRRAALSVAQARERRALPPEVRATRLATEATGRVCPPDLCRRVAGVTAAALGTAAPQRVGDAELGEWD